LTETIKWAASLLSGGAIAGLYYMLGHIGMGPDISPWIAVPLAAAVVKAINWAISKIPV